MYVPFLGRRFRPTHIGEARIRPRRDLAHLGAIQYAGDKLRAHQAGNVLGIGDEFAGDNEELPARRLIDADQDKHKVDVERRANEPQAQLEDRRTEAQKALDQTERDIGEGQEQDGQLAAELEERGDHQGLGRTAYGIVLAVVGLILWPVDRTIAQVLPLGKAGQFILAVGIGVLTCFIAHLAGKKLHAVVWGWATRKERPAQFWADAALLALLLLGPVTVLVLVGRLRAALLQAIQQITGNAVDVQPTKVNAALTAIQLLAYLGAAVFAFIYAQGEDRRRIERKRRTIQRRIKRKRRYADTCEQYIAKVDKKLARIERRVDLEKEAIEAKRARRHARHDQALHKVRNKTARKATERDDIERIEQQTRPIELDVRRLGEGVQPEVRTNHEGA